MLCTASAAVRSQSVRKQSSRTSRARLGARTLISSCAASARSTSFTTSSVRPLAPMMTTGSRGWARALSNLRSAGVKMSTLFPQDFHPVVRQWWGSRFGDPTPAQLEGWSAIRRGEHTLIAAPTGSGKTLAAFLTSIDELLKEGVAQGGLPDEVRVIYVSPLKALSADIHKNLAVPRREIFEINKTKITAAVRSGDTPQNERAAMLR